MDEAVGSLKRGLRNVVGWAEKGKTRRSSIAMLNKTAVAYRLICNITQSETIRETHEE